MIRKFASLLPICLGLLAAVMAMTAVPGRSSAQDEPAYASWFTPAEAVNLNWAISQAEGDPLKVLIRQKYADSRKKPYRVFVLFPRRSSAYDIAMTKILEVFEEKDVSAEFTIVNFNNDEELGEKAIQLAESEGHDLIFSMGSQSTAWLWSHYQGGAIPVVSVCSKDPVVLGQAEDYHIGTGTNFAFTSLNMPVEVQMAYVLELKPELKNFAVLVNSKNVSAVETQAKPIAEYARQRGIRVLEVVVEDPQNAAVELAAKVRDAVATMRKNDPTLNDSLFWITGSTAVFREIRAINANSDRVPVLSVVPDVVKAGDDSAVLSIGITFESNGHLAAIYGADVLQGRAKAGDLEVGIVSPPDIAINFRKAREIALEVPFTFFESASFLYDYEGRTVRNNGKAVAPVN